MPDLGLHPPEASVFALPLLVTVLTHYVFSALNCFLPFQHLFILLRVCEWHPWSLASFVHVVNPVSYKRCPYTI